MTTNDKYSAANKAMADVLEGARGKARLSVMALSEASGVPYGTLVKVLNNKTAIDVGHITSLAPALNRTPKSLMDEATEDIGGMDALIEAADKRARRNGVEPLSVVPGSNVTKLSDRKKNSDLTAEQIETGREDKAATEVDPESKQDQSDET